jgi:hypothetical protein
MKKTRFIQLGLILIGSVMLLSGVLLGEPNTVLHKAIMICLECMGIG